MEMKDEKKTRLYTIPQVARICQVARGTVDRWHRDDPDFPRKFRIGGSARFVADEVDAWLLRRVAAAGSHAR